MSDDSSVSVHYEDLLADIYTWMAGGAEARLSEARAFFERHGLVPLSSARALDLGAGSGFQSIPLAERGFRVMAVDLSDKLLAELRARARGLSIDTRKRSILPLDDYVAGPLDVVVCMGDTLAHLASADEVRGLVAQSARHLVTGGRLVLTWRDLTRLPEGSRRFLPVRSDAHRILTCFVEGVDDERVRVHDLLHIRDGDGFRQHVGSYLKLRLSPGRVDDELRANGLRVVHAAEERGWVTRIAERPRSSRQP